MIQSKNDLKVYLREDKIANLGQTGWVGQLWSKINSSSAYSSWKFLSALRHYEYALNCCQQSLLGKFYCRYCQIRFNRLSVKYNIVVNVNTLGYGCHLHHVRRGGHVLKAKSIGNYFDVRQFTTIGVKSNERCNELPMIGDNVFVGSNSVIIGDIKIGNNAIIGAGAVVINDIPDNCIAVGNPARVLAHKVNMK